MDLSIIIVNYNTYELTKQTIESVITTVNDDFTYEILLVDNASKGSCLDSLSNEYASHDKVTLIRNKDNLGFSKANNIGIKASVGDYILTLNSDTILQKNCLQNCLAFIREHNDIGALGCKVTLADNTLDHACKRGFPTPEASLFYFLKLHKFFPDSDKFTQYTLGTQDINSTNDVDSLTGAFMILPRSVINEVGVFDEDFFMYGEDLDWCYRIKNAGYRIVYYPKASTIHLKGGSNGKKKRTKTIYEFHRAMLLFYNKHYRTKYWLPVTVLMYVSIGVKLIISLALNELKKS